MIHYGLAVTDNLRSSLKLGNIYNLRLISLYIKSCLRQIVVFISGIFLIMVYKEAAPIENA